RRSGAGTEAIHPGKRRNTARGKWSDASERRLLRRRNPAAMDVYLDESPSKEKCPPPCSANVEDSQHPINACPSIKNVGKVSISRPLVRLQSKSPRRSDHAIPAADL